MIEIGKTIIDTTVARVKELSLQAKQDPFKYRPLISLMIIQDLINWGENLEIPKNLLDYLVQYRDTLMIKHPDYFKQYVIHSSNYTNVNIHKDERQWQRVWDKRTWQGLPVGQIS